MKGLPDIVIVSDGSEESLDGVLVRPSVVWAFSLPRDPVHDEWLALVAEWLALVIGAE